MLHLKVGLFGTAELEHYVEAMHGYRNVTDDKIVSTFLNIEDLDRNLQTAGQVNPSGAGGEAGGDGYQWSPDAGGAGEEPPPYPTYTAPATLDECWADPFFGDRFRTWTMDKAIADNTMLCLAIEQE